MNFLSFFFFWLINICTRRYRLSSIIETSPFTSPFVLSAGICTLSAYSGTHTCTHIPCNLSARRTLRESKRGIRGPTRTWTKRSCVPSKHAERGRPGKALNPRDIPWSAFTTKRVRHDGRLRISGCRGRPRLEYDSNADGMKFVQSKRTRIFYLIWYRSKYFAFSVR